MFIRFWFNRMSVDKRVRFMMKKGIGLGTRLREGRQVYMYMFHDIFAEIIFKNDDPRLGHESISVTHGIEELNRKLEQEIRLKKFW